MAQGILFGNCILGPFTVFLFPVYYQSKMFSFKVDDQQEEAALSHTTSVQSFAETQPESTIIRQTALNSTVFSAGIQSPDSVDDRCLLIQ